MNYPYTRLQDTYLWRAAFDQYRRNGHAYHNMQPHIFSIYCHAEAFGWPYDPDLDASILTHDVILDRAADPELRSAAWLEQQVGHPMPKASALTLTTIDHRPSSPDNRMALLDLADFMDPSARSRNSRLLRDEAERAKGDDFDQVEWVRGTLTYLSGLHGRVKADLESGVEIAHRPHWERVLHGIACTMATLPLRYAPHPAQGIQRYTPGQEAVLLRLGQSECSQDQLRDYCADGVISVDRMPGILSRLKEENLIHLDTSAGQIALSEHGRSWFEKMTAPDEDWPEPDM